MDTLELIIKDVVKNKNWDEIIEIFIQDKINAKVVDDANRILIKQLASKDSIIDAPNKVKEKLTSYLRTVLVDKKWKGIVDVITAGTAFEKTVSERRNADVLDFYELIWAKNRIPVKTRELNFSKERWLKRKIILANTIIGSKRKLLKDVEKKIEEWSFVIDVAKLPEYPSLDYKETAFMKGTLEINLDEKQKKAIELMRNHMGISDLSELLHLDEEVISNFLKKLKS